MAILKPKQIFGRLRAVWTVIGGRSGNLRRRLRVKQMLKELLSFRGSLAGIVITVVGAVIANLALPAYLSTIINDLIPSRDIAGIFQVGGTMLYFVLLGVISNIATGYFASRVSVGMGRQVRGKIFKRIQYFSQKEFDEFSSSSLITRTNNDVVQVQTFINMLLRISLMAPFMCIGGIIMAFTKNSTMSMILFISMPVMVIFVLVVGRRTVPLSQKMQEKLDDINRVIREKLTGIRVARAFGTEEYEAKRFDGINLDFMENAIRMNNTMGILMPGLSLVLYATMVALLGFGGYQIINSANSIPIGDIIAVIQYAMQIMMAVMMLSMVFVMYPRASVSAGRIVEVYRTEPSIVSSENSVLQGQKKGYVSFRDVTFTFPGAAEPAIKNISFESGPGEVTAIIGSTGSGKSTLVNLIPRFYDISQGEILVDGVNVKDYNVETLRRKIGLVPQKAFLFKGTISENIQFGDDTAREKRIEEAVKIAQSYDFVTQKEGGFKAPIAQGGSNVSGGQKQRLAIARAIVRKPEIYIFDDSFSALDFKTDAALRKALLAEAKEATMILVAQRISTIMNADRILVLEGGECVGMGRHEELLENCMVYQEIVHSQFKKEEA